MAVDTGLNGQTLEVVVDGVYIGTAVLPPAFFRGSPVRERQLRGVRIQLLLARYLDATCPPG